MLMPNTDIYPKCSASEYFLSMERSLKLSLMGLYLDKWPHVASHIITINLILCSHLSCFPLTHKLIHYQWKPELRDERGPSDASSRRPSSISRLTFTAVMSSLCEHGTTAEVLIRPAASWQCNSADLRQHFWFYSSDKSVALNNIYT